MVDLWYCAVLGGHMLRIEPATLKEANAYVTAYHRHNKAVRGCRFCLRVVDDDGVHGYAIVGRPLARMLQDGVTAEVLRVCTRGKSNAASKLLAACARVWRAMGGGRLITYTRQDEVGASLRAAGWVVDGATRAESWNRAKRARVDQVELIPRVRWVPQWCRQIKNEVTTSAGL